MRYRVLIEIGGDDDHFNKTEISGSAETYSRMAEDVGISLADALCGACDDNEPSTSEILAWFMHRINHTWDCENSIGEVTKEWWTRKDPDCDLDDICKVVVLKSFMKEPQYATAVDELPKGDK